MRDRGLIGGIVGRRELGALQFGQRMRAFLRAVHADEMRDAADLLRRRAHEFAAIGTDVVLWSVDTVFSHLAWTHLPRNKGGLGAMKVPIIGDVSKELSKAYGALIEGEGDGDAGLTLRGTFVVDPKGVLRYAALNDLPVGRSVDEVLRIVQVRGVGEGSG